MQKLSLSKKERLNSKKEIEYLFTRKNSISLIEPPLQLIFTIDKTDNCQLSRVLFIVSKKRFKSAVKRNQIRRKIKEAYRLNKATLYTFTEKQDIKLLMAINYISKEESDFSMIDEKTGYIVLTQFNNKASSQTAYAVKDLKAQGAERLILDLRGNPGGLVHEAVNIVNLFVPKGQLVVETKSKVKKFNRTYYTQRDALDAEIPLVVLIMKPFICGV